MNEKLTCCETETQLFQDFKHVKSCWCCFFMLGLLLVACGTVAVVIPPLFTLLTPMVLGILLMVAGIVTIISSFWIGKWSGMLMSLLAGIFYLVVGLVVSERPVASAVLITLFIATTFIVLGIFRIVSALMLRFPQWGWALVNGVITLLLGVVIYRHLRESALWVIGILVGVELLINGWSWIMLSLAVRKLPDELPTGQ
jgi:uncharacterized membrane protein HdeD (DUF308 family)